MIILTPKRKLLRMSVQDFLLHPHGNHRDAYSFPTRRSSDLAEDDRDPVRGRPGLDPAGEPARHPQDRKSTRLNSSHVSTSYAVFCLIKKKRTFKDIRDEYNYPKKKGSKDECSRMLEDSTLRS